VGIRSPILSEWRRHYKPRYGGQLLLMGGVFCLLQIVFCVLTAPNVNYWVLLFYGFGATSGLLGGGCAVLKKRFYIALIGSIILIICGLPGIVYFYRVFSIGGIILAKLPHLLAAFVYPLVNIAIVAPLIFGIPGICHIILSKEKFTS